MKINNIFKILLFYILIPTSAFGREPYSFITGAGNNYASARTAASKIAISQGMRIIGQNYYQDKDGNWTVTLKVKSQ